MCKLQINKINKYCKKYNLPYFIQENYNMNDLHYYFMYEWSNYIITSCMNTITTLLYMSDPTILLSYLYYIIYFSKFIFLYKRKILEKYYIYKN